MIPIWFFKLTFFGAGTTPSLIAVVGATTARSIRNAILSGLHARIHLMAD
jgi:hypothetical protein